MTDQTTRRGKHPPADDSPKLPDDVQDLVILHVELCASPMVRASVEQLLHEGGHLYTVLGQGKLASRRVYLDTLEAFCARAGLPQPVVQGIGSAQRQRAVMQRAVDEATARYRARKGWRAPE